MISIKRSRELIEGSEEYSDTEIRKIRDTLDALAELAFEHWQRERESQKKKIQK